MTDQSGPHLSLALGDDKKTMKVAIINDGTLRAGIVLSAEQLESLIAGLSQIRGNMDVPPAVSLKEDLPPRDAPNAQFHFATNTESGELVLSLRNPGGGWLSLRLTVRQLERMLGVARKAAKQFA
jgi:hypothetical protein